MNKPKITERPSEKKGGGLTATHNAASDGVIHLPLSDEIKQAVAAMLDPNGSTFIGSWEHS